jgi:iron complex outermembrane receptor protein
VGLKYSHPFITASFASFILNGKNMIDWVKADADALWESKNHTKIGTKGVEATINFDLKEWIGHSQPFTSLIFGYMYIDQNIEESELISNYRLNYLRHKFTAALQHEVIDNLTFSWKFRWQDRIGSYIQYIDLQPGELAKYTPFGLLDVKVDYKLNKVNLFLNANNIFNVQQVDFGNIPQPGFWLSGGVSIKM